MSSDRRRRSLCADFSALCMEQGIPEEKLGSVNDVKEWEEARCPICMEHPHNAILLKCTSHGKGCRPYICNTNYWYASCVDQFCNSFVPDASRALHPCEISLQTKVLKEKMRVNTYERRRQMGLKQLATATSGSHVGGGKWVSRWSRWRGYWVARSRWVSLLQASWRHGVGVDSGIRWSWGG
ncbi:hypothetical protein SO802_005740 [Lithocarpus litseifolius]|uniref:Uncharacterized protein n=1 Tax=Lithocarpus litseifolius TaxID=425828 RepID=A0AAW2DJD6_9ROSI